MKSQRTPWLVALVLPSLLSTDVNSQSASCPILDQFKPEGRRPDGELFWNPQNRRLYLRTRPTTVWGALGEASRNQGQLVTINDGSEQSWLVAAIGSSSPHWIGLRRLQAHGAFRWMSGESVGFTNWEPNFAEPNDGGCGDGSCPGEPFVVMNWNGSGMWNDVTANPETDIFAGLVEVEAPIVCVRVRSAGPVGSLRFGHTWITLDPNNGNPPLSFGIYPSGNPLRPLPAALDDEAQSVHNAEACFVVSPSQFQRIAGAILADNSSYMLLGGLLGLDGENCTSWAAKMLAAGGVEMPSYSAYGIASPEVLYDSILALGGCESSGVQPRTSPTTIQAASYLGMLEDAMLAPVPLAAAFELALHNEPLGALAAAPGAPVSLVVDPSAARDALLAVDWGDGSRDAQLTTFEHRYAAEGAYTITFVSIDAGTLRRMQSTVQVLAGAGAATQFVVIPYSPPSSWTNVPGVPPQGSLDLASTRSFANGCSDGPSLTAALPRIGEECPIYLANTPPRTPGVIAIGRFWRIRRPERCGALVEMPAAAIHVLQSDDAGLGALLLTIPDSISLIGAEFLAQARMASTSRAYSNALLFRIGR